MTVDLDLYNHCALVVFLFLLSKSVSRIVALGVDLSSIAGGKITSVQTFIVRIVSNVLVVRNNVADLWYDLLVGILGAFVVPLTAAFCSRIATSVS